MRTSHTNPDSRLASVPRWTPRLRAGPSPVGVRKGPQPYLNITPLQKRQSDGGKQSVLRQRRLKTCQRYSFPPIFLGYTLLHNVPIHSVARGVGGAARSGRRIVWRHGHCMRLGIYGGTHSSGGTARVNSKEWPRFSHPTGSYWTLCSVTMSCLDVMYHQSYAAHYLPAAAYKATCYNHHQQQQQVRPSSSHTDFIYLFPPEVI